MAWTKTETLSSTPDSLGRKNVVETWSLKDRDGVAVATITKDADDDVTFNVSGQPKVYRALLTQTGTDAPVATVLENTLGGTLVWTYADVGLYVGTLEGAFTANKTCLPPVNASQTLDGATSFVETSFFRADADVVRLQTTLVDAGAGTQTLSNAFLTNAYVEILVYP